MPDRAISVDELPWVPQGERVWFKPLRFELTAGRWINLLKVQSSGRVDLLPGRVTHPMIVQDCRKGRSD